MYMHVLPTRQLFNFDLRASQLVQWISFLTHKLVARGSENGQSRVDPFVRCI